MDTIASKAWDKARVIKKLKTIHTDTHTHTHTHAKLDFH